MHNSAENTLIDIISADAREVVKRVNLSELRGKSILITGASGLLGVHFLACLKEINLEAKEPVNVNAVIHSEPPSYFNALFGQTSFRFIQSDLTNTDFVNTLPKGDYIIHAAGYGQPGRFMENPVKTLQLNTDTTFKLFECLNRDGKFLFVSSSEVYSGLTTSPHKETEIGLTNTTHLRSCYIEGKRCGEAICNAHRAQEVQAKSARLALAYGPGTRKGDRRVLNAFVEKGLNGKIELMDQGHAWRTYCYVGDAVEIMWNILLYGKEPIYNVGGNSRTTIADLAKQIGGMLKVPVVFPTESHEMTEAPSDVFLDMSLVEQDFKKTEYVSLSIGLGRTIEWQKALYSS